MYKTKQKMRWKASSELLAELASQYKNLIERTIESSHC